MCGLEQRATSRTPARIGSAPLMRIGVPKESVEGERRVALVPEVVKKLVAKGHDVVVEGGAGEAALVPDGLFADAGATIGDPWGAEVVVKVAPPANGELSHLSAGQTLIGFLNPRGNPDGLPTTTATGATAFAMEASPRHTRAPS